MKKAGEITHPNERNPLSEPVIRPYQPGYLIIAEILFAFLLLYFANKPVEIKPLQAAADDPITVEIPAVGVAIAENSAKNIVHEIEKKVVHHPR